MTTERYPGPEPIEPYGRRVPPPNDGPSSRFEESRPRPYMLTGGRVRPIDASIEIEAQVLTTSLGRAAAPRHAFEHQEILNLCIEPMSVAEVAGRLGIHLGVARVLVSDLVTIGQLSLRRPHTGAHRRVDVIERVIRGLEAIS